MFRSCRTGERLLKISANQNEKACLILTLPLESFSCLHGFNFLRYSEGESTTEWSLHFVIPHPSAPNTGQELGAHLRRLGRPVAPSIVELVRLRPDLPCFKY